MKPTTTITILGGTETEDQFGDPVDNTTVIASGVPAAIMERRQTVFLPGSNQPRIVRYHTGRLVYGTAISEANRIKDEVTNDIFVIENTSQLQSPVKRQELRLDLRRVDGDA